MIAALLFFLGPSVALGDGDRVHYVDASIEPEGRLIGGRFVDVDGDRKLELCMALEIDGRRELHWHKVEPQRIDPNPWRRVEVKSDVIAYGFADVRTELGDELLFLTKDGFYSYSLEKEGYRGNIERLVKSELLYDLADPKSLPEWRFVLSSQWGDRVLVPGREGVAVWGRAEADVVEAAVRSLGSFTATEGSTLQPSDEAERRRRSEEEGNGGEEDSEQHTMSLGSGGLRFHVTRDAEILLMPEDEQSSFQLLTSSHAYDAPAVTDVNRDGNSDLLFAVGKELRVHLSKPEGFSKSPDRHETFPTYMDDEEQDTTIFLRDIDDDGDTDLLVELTSEGEESLGNRESTLLCLLNDGDRLLPAQPHQVFRFKAAALRVELTDVDGDGRLDLALRKFEMPGMIESVTGLEFKLTHLVFFGQKKGTPFQRKPGLRQSRSYDETSFREIIANRELEMDCDGDGIADLVEVDLEGRIAIRRLKRSSSFFGGESWSLERTPWKRFDVYGNVDSVEVRDVNGDGLGDVISEGDEAMTVLLSQKR